MSLKPILGAIESESINMPGSTVDGNALIQGNILNNGTPGFLPSTKSLSDIIGSRPLPDFGASAGAVSNGVIENVTSIGSDIGSSLQAAVTGGINQIGGTITDNVNAISTSINQVKQDITDTVSSVKDVVSAVASGDMGKIVAAIMPSLSFNTSPSTDMSLCYPETLKNTSLNPAHIMFQFFEKNTSVTSTCIHLPMPDNVSNPSTINWEATDFGMIGNAAVKSVKAIKGNTVNKDDIRAELTSMLERVKSVAAYTVASEVINGLGGEKNLSTDDIMGASSGKITNPYKTFLFRGVNFRTFSFKFNMVPFKESDCYLIDNIVKSFRTHSYPDFGGEKMFFEYPDECQITYMWESDANKWLHNFKRAVCSSIDANYAPLGQWASLRNGFPYMIELTTGWTETSIITKGDINKANTDGQRS